MLSTTKANTNSALKQGNDTHSQYGLAQNLICFPIKFLGEGVHEIWTRDLRGVRIIWCFHMSENEPNSADEEMRFSLHPRNQIVAQ